MPLPSNTQVTTAPGKSCRGCIWENEHSSVCHEVARVARLAKLPDCEYSNLIYVLKPIDERQLELIEGEKT